jgi:hypothetical protein
MDPDQTARAGLDPCWLQTHYVGFVLVFSVGLKLLTMLTLRISFGHSLRKTTLFQAQVELLAFHKLVC